MKKYIDPEKLPRLFRDGARKNKSAFLQDENGDALVVLSEVRKALSLATVEEPVKRGRWRYIFRTAHAHISCALVCNVCGASTDRIDGAVFNYCPKCGAKMDGEEEREQ